jgi:hypothetical protein
VLNPLDDLGPFDVALSTFFFHHRGTNQKRKALAKEG